MTQRTKKMLQLVELLPETEQELIDEMTKRVVLAWDPDFTKVTQEERKRMDKASQELKDGEYASHDDFCVKKQKFFSSLQKQCMKSS